MDLQFEVVHAKVKTLQGVALECDQITHEACKSSWCNGFVLNPLIMEVALTQYIVLIFHVTIDGVMEERHASHSNFYIQRLSVRPEPED